MLQSTDKQFGNMPKIIAQFLGLSEMEKYTGHCFRRTAATLLADSGANSKLYVDLVVGNLSVFANVVVPTAATLTLTAAPRGQQNAMRITDQCTNQRATSIGF